MQAATTAAGGGQEAHRGSVGRRRSRLHQPEQPGGEDDAEISAVPRVDLGLDQQPGGAPDAGTPGGIVGNPGEGEGGGGEDDPERGDPPPATAGDGRDWGWAWQVEMGGRDFSARGMIPKRRSAKRPRAAYHSQVAMRSFERELARWSSRNRLRGRTSCGILRASGGFTGQEITQEMFGGEAGDGVPVHVGVFGLPGHAAVGRTGDAIDPAAGLGVDEEPIEGKKAHDALAQEPEGAIQGVADRYAGEQKDQLQG